MKHKIVAFICGYLVVVVINCSMGAIWAITGSLLHVVGGVTLSPPALGYERISMESIVVSGMASLISGLVIGLIVKEKGSLYGGIFLFLFGIINQGIDLILGSSEVIGELLITLAIMVLCGIIGGYEGEHLIRKDEDMKSKIKAFIWGYLTMVVITCGIGFLWSIGGGLLHFIGGVPLSSSVSAPIIIILSSIIIFGFSSLISGLIIGLIVKEKGSWYGRIFIPIYGIMIFGIILMWSLFITIEESPFEITPLYIACLSLITLIIMVLGGFAGGQIGEFLVKRHIKIQT
ncbi:MAG: hypothetical protein AB1567_07855 [bacterium]